MFGLWVLRLTKRLEQSQWRNQKLIEKRIAVWDDVGPVLNDIYCYCMRIGAWKKFTPLEIIAKKREADKKVHLSRPYFSDGFFSRYVQPTRACFEMYQGHGIDAKLKTPLWEHQNANQAWDKSWDRLFHDKPSDDAALARDYDALLHQVQIDLSPNV
jgi:hypothetical protein